jgi:hypothetical protein
MNASKKEEESFWGTNKIRPHWSGIYAYYTKGSVHDDTNLMGENITMMTEAESILGAGKEVRLGRITQN